MSKHKSKKAKIAQRIRQQIEDVIATIRKYHEGRVTPEQALYMMKPAGETESDRPYIDDAIRKNQIEVVEDDDYRYIDEELKELTRMAQLDGNTLAKNRIFGLLRPLLLQQYGRIPVRMPLEDFMAIAYVVVMEYIDSYDLVRGADYRFTNFLPQRLLDAIRGYLEDEDGQGVSAKLIGQVAKCMDRRDRAGESMDIRSIAEEVGCSEWLANHVILKLTNKLYVSIDASVSDSGETEKIRIADLLTECECPYRNRARFSEHIPAQEQVRSEYETCEFIADIHGAIDSLPQLEAAVISMVYGIDSPDNATAGIETVRKQLHISREQARQACIRAEEKLRRLLIEYADTFF